MRHSCCFWGPLCRAVVVFAASACTPTVSGPQPASPLRTCPSATITPEVPPAPVDAGAELAPVAVSAPSPGPASRLLALGAEHSCLSLPSSGVFCWGDNRRGQVGIGSEAEQVASPVRVRARGAHVLGAGAEHSCADDECWGRNTEGQLGDGANIDRGRPTRVSVAGHERLDVLRPWQWIMLGRGSWAARKAAYGYESLALGSVPYVGMTCGAPGTPCTQWLLSAASFGDTLCAQLSGYSGPEVSRVHCSQHQDLLERDIAGNGDATVPAPSLGSFYAISLGDRFACAVRRDHRIECWGDLSALRGDGVRRRSTWVSGYWSATSVVVGSGFGCFIRADERAFCFGTEPSMGLLRAGILPNAQPIAIVGGAEREPRRASVIAAGPHHACAFDLSDHPMCWGSNKHGQLGNGTLRDSATAVDVQLPEGA